MGAEGVKGLLAAKKPLMVLGAAAAFLALSLVLLVGSLASTGHDPEAEQALIDEVSAEAEQAEADLVEKHDELLASLEGTDASRVQRDLDVARSIALGFAESPGTTRTLEQQQRHLDARWDFLGPDSRALTVFLPELMATTGSTHGAGQPYRVAAIDVEVVSVRGLDYTYAGTVRIEEVDLEGSGPAGTEFFTIRFSTNAEGGVDDVALELVSPASRDEILAAEPEDEEDDEEAEQ